MGNRNRRAPEPSHRLQHLFRIGTGPQIRNVDLGAAPRIGGASEGRRHRIHDSTRFRFLERRNRVEQNEKCEAQKEHAEKKVAAAILRRRKLRSSEEHTSELQSLMRISYAVFSLTNKT